MENSLSLKKSNRDSLDRNKNLKENTRTSGGEKRWRTEDAEPHLGNHSKVGPKTGNREATSQRFPTKGLLEKYALTLAETLSFQATAADRNVLALDITYIWFVKNQ